MIGGLTAWNLVDPMGSFGADSRYKGQISTTQPSPIRWIFALQKKGDCNGRRRTVLDLMPGFITICGHGQGTA
jgi:hypothetical protein